MHASCFFILLVALPLQLIAALDGLQEFSDLLEKNIFRQSLLNLNGKSKPPTCKLHLASCTQGRNHGDACCPAGPWPGYCSESGRCEGRHTQSPCEANEQCYSNRCVNAICQPGEAGSLCELDSNGGQCTSGLCMKAPISRLLGHRIGVCENDPFLPTNPEETPEQPRHIKHHEQFHEMFHNHLGSIRIRRDVQNGQTNVVKFAKKGAVKSKRSKRSGDYQKELVDYINKKAKGDDDDDDDNRKPPAQKAQAKAKRQQQREKLLKRIREKVRKTGKPRILKVQKGPEKPKPQTRFTKVTSSMDKLSITKISGYASTLNSLNAQYSFDMSDDVNINHVYTNGPDAVTHQTDITDVSQSIEISNITQVTEQVNIVNITRYVTINYVVRIYVVDVVHDLPCKDVIVTTHSVDVTNILDISHRINISNTYEITHNVDISNITKTSTSSKVDRSGNTTDIVNVRNQTNEVKITDVTNIVNITNIEDVTDVRSITTTYEIVRVVAPSEKAAEEYLANQGTTTVKPVQQRGKRWIAAPFEQEHWANKAETGYEADALRNDEKAANEAIMVADPEGSEDPPETFELNKHHVLDPKLLLFLVS